MGVLGLAQYASCSKEHAFDIARSDLRDFTEDFLNSVLDGDDAGEGAVLAAKSLQRLILDEHPGNRDYEGIRNAVGQAQCRNSDYVRTQEDALLKLIARAFWTHADGTPPAGPTMTSDPPEEELLPGKPPRPSPGESRIPPEGSSRFCSILHNLRATLIDFVLETSKREQRWRLQPTDVMAGLVDEALLYVGSYFSFRQKAQWIGPPLDTSLNLIEEQLWPSPFRNTIPDHAALQAKLISCATGAAGDVDRFKEYLRGRPALDAKSAAVLKNMDKQIQHYAVGMLTDHECDAIRICATCHKLEHYWATVDGREPFAALTPLTDCCQGDILYLVSRRYEPWRRMTT